MFAIILFIATFISHAYGAASCDKLGVNFYDELNCTQGEIASDGCPSTYDCVKYDIPDGKCLYYGREIENGESVNGYHCNMGYQCVATPHSKGAFEKMVEVDCFWEDFKPGCYFAGELNSCCDEVKCPPFKSNFTCKVGDETFHENELFTPKDTCWNCVCKKGFTGKLEAPYCVRRPCDMELHYSGSLQHECAPVFRQYSDSEALCCPHDFICPGKFNMGEVKDNGTEDLDAPKCTFDGVDYNIGATMKLTYKEIYSNRDTEVTCECRLPPYITCVKHMN